MIVYDVSVGAYMCIHAYTQQHVFACLCLPACPSSFFFFFFFLVVLLYVHRFEVLLYVHRNRRLIRDGEPRTATSTFTQLLSSGSTEATCGLLRTGDRCVCGGGGGGGVSGTDG